MLRHVLIPLDGSTLAERAIDAARNILKPDGKITLLAAVNASDIMGEVVPQEAQHYMDHHAKNLKLHGYQVDIEMGTGDPAHLIIDRATTLGVDAICMSTQGRSGLSRLLFGSITLEVLNDTPCPIFLVPDRERVEVKDEGEAPALGFDVLPAE